MQNKMINMKKLHVQFLRVLHELRKNPDTKYPLGRWHNCGDYYNEEHLKMKVFLKEERMKMRQRQIDPFDKYDKESYLRPYVYDY